MFYKLLWCWMINYFFPPFSDKEMRWHLNLGTIKDPRGITACYCGSWPCVAGGVLMFQPKKLHLSWSFMNLLHNPMSREKGGT